MGKCPAWIFVIYPCQSTLTVVKFMSFVLHMVKKETERWRFPKSHKSRHWKLESKKIAWFPLERGTFEYQHYEKPGVLSVRIAQGRR